MNRYAPWNKVLTAFSSVKLRRRENLQKKQTENVENKNKKNETEIKIKRDNFILNSVFVPKKSSVFGFFSFLSFVITSYAVYLFISLSLKALLLFVNKENALQNRHSCKVF